ncbi:MAG: hypothetical protein WD555_03745 [Fulvivirga sp.]
MAPKKMAPTGQYPIDAKNRLDSNQKQQSNILIFPRNLKELRQLKNDYLRAKYPNVPRHGIGKVKPYKDTTANGLTRCIIDAFNFCEGQAERISNTGRVIDNSYTYTNVIGQKKTIGGKKYIPGTGTNGTADISAIWNGLSLKIEVKIGRDKLGEAQEKYRDRIEASGGVYIVARSYEDFVLELEKKLATVKNTNYYE